ncbi:MAG TPA: hypothetical protein EYH03_05005 [Chromatiales bacterium]|nr:hypothetical protein [Chromatiales bacterium]
MLFVGVASVTAGPREQARRIHDRIAGVPPSNTVLDAMEADIAAGNDLQAAFTAMENSAFYNVTLKNLAAPWTNEEQSVFVPLNDYTATVIGMVRDDIPFTELLSADLVYVGDPALGLPPYSMTSNDHYEALESQGIDLKQHLVAVTQSSVTDLPVDATAGVMTSRAASKAFFSAGTNRAMYRFTMLNHLCVELEEIKDNTLSSDRVRQDVSRSPGGDSRIFLNNCVGCHTGMEPLTQAYAYYDFDETAGRLVYNREGTIDPDTGTRVKKKYLINADTFKYGYITRDDRWDNYWRQGRNASLGWNPNLPGGGNGAKSMGKELAHSEAFARCQVKKVFKAVCFREPGNAADRGQVDAMVTSFKNNNYSLKQVFAESAVYCKGD